MTLADTNLKATAAAEFVYECLHFRHRGILDCQDKFIIFGNDGYRTESGDARAVREVELMSEYLKQTGLWGSRNRPEFGTSADGYSWCLVVFTYDRRPIDFEDLTEKLYEFWQQACKEKQAATTASS